MIGHLVLSQHYSNKSVNISYLKCSKSVIYLFFKQILFLLFTFWLYPGGKDYHVHLYVFDITPCPEEDQTSNFQTNMFYRYIDIFLDVDAFLQ